MKNYAPMIIENRGRGEKHIDIYSKLLKDRIVVLKGEIEDEMAMDIVGQLLYLNNEDPEKEIKMYINSPGGVITAGLAIYDTMQLIKPKITTICIGQAASMGAFLLSVGDYRQALPHSRIMIHQPLGGAYGQATDIEIQAKEIIYIKKQLNQILSEASGQSLEKIEQDTERDFFLNAKEAKEYGLIDSIIEKK